MENLSIIKSLFDGNHLSDDELLIASKLIHFLKVEVMNRVKKEVVEDDK